MPSRNKVSPDGLKGASILIVGEAPGETENFRRLPFVGRSGDKLIETLQALGVSRSEVYLANLCNYQPPYDNRFETLEASLIEEGVEELKDYILTYNPNIIIALGEYPLRYLTGRESISSNRGSVLPCVFDPTVKVYCCYHPSYILRNPDLNFLFFFDLKRAIQLSGDKLFPYRKRTYHIVDSSNIDEATTKILKAGVSAVDIESSKKDKKVICVGFSTSPDESYSIAYNDFTYPYIKLLLENESLSKIFHYGFCFDIEMLAMHGIEVKGTIDDTYILAHAYDPRLPRGLDFLTSIHTFEPFYKTQGRAALPGDSKAWGEKLDKKEVYIYNAKDCAVTHEIFQKIMEDIDEVDLATYRFEIEDAHLGLEISRTGLPFSEENREKLRDAVFLKWHKKQIVLNSIIGKPFNVNSSKQVPTLLYDNYCLPVKKNAKGGRTADDKALVELVGHLSTQIDKSVKEETKNKYRLQLAVIQLIRDIRGYRKLMSSYINVELNQGRCKSMVNVAGTDFGRWSSSLYIDSTGANNQTWPRGAFELPEAGDSVEEFKKLLSEEFKNEKDTYDSFGDGM